MTSFVTKVNNVPNIVNGDIMKISQKYIIQVAPKYAPQLHLKSLMIMQ